MSPAICRLYGLRLRNCLHFLRCCLRNCQGRPWRVLNGCLTTRLGCKERGLIDIVPVVMAGIIAIYGLVVSVLVANDLKQNLPLYTGMLQLCIGFSVGLTGLASGFAIGVVGDAGVRGIAQQPRLYVGMILILIFAEVLGLYGLIVALLMNSVAKHNVEPCI
ncbi:ATPase F0/V0 complex subunit C [Penicillium cf. griseofulvum]|nr:ATPase F0/V0 complex subunit C [Penicillium cf. griseofulvum]